MARVLRRMPGRDEELEALRASWSRAVGRGGAGKSTVLRRSRQGILTVACSSASVAQELHFQRELLRERLEVLVPGCELSGIRFVVGDHAILSSTTARRRSPARPTPAHRAAAAAALRGVSDPRLRELLMRAAAAMTALQEHQKRANSGENRR